MEDTFDPDLLDDDDPFEIDEGNLPHLVGHGFGLTDLWELWEGTPYWSEDEQHPGRLKLHGPIPGDYLVVPCAASSSGDVHRCRPITIFSVGPPEEGDAE